MLARLENAYLYILRVVVLIAATVALLGVVLGLVRGATLLPELIAPKTVSADVPGGTLGDYVAEKHAAGITVAASGPATAQPAPPAIRAAATSLEHYLSTRDGFAVDDAAYVGQLAGQQATLPDDVQDQYGESLKALASQLDLSKGTPLSADQVTDLVNWHFDKFKSAVEQTATERVAKQAEELGTLAVAGGAFALFLGLVLNFLIVKIERNLRLVRTVTAPASEATV